MAKAKKIKETKAVAPTAAALPPVERAPESAWGSEGLSNSDILVSKILLMQGLSDLVADGKASPGQMRDSVNGDLLGDKAKPCQIIPFSSFRTWVVFENRNGKDEYVKTMPITPENEGLPINEIVDNIEVRRDKCLNFYVLRPEDIASGIAFPYLVSFRRYGTMAGKKLTTFAAKLKAFKKPMAAKAFLLTVQTEENDKGKFFSFDVSMDRDTSPQELSEAHKWYQTFQTAVVKADDSDLKAEAKPRPQGQSAHVNNAPDASQDY